MPIRPENRDRYPKDWPLISRRIRTERAKGRCECEGECRRGTHLDRSVRMPFLVKERHYSGLEVVKWPK